MRNVTIEKPTVEEAIAAALKELRAENNEVEIEIINEPSKGFFGLGSKDAKVKVTITNGPEERARKFIDILLKKMSIEADYEVNYSDNILNVDIVKIGEDDKGIVIGKRGKNLDEIQFLLNLMVNKGRENYVRVIFNVEDYRAKREETLKRLALKMADKCRYYNRKVKLEPMNPYERRIIHSTLQDVKGIITYSEGEEPYRKVVIDQK
ncbi:MAG TPA: RNA-binding cell elongation regulator Jag/EloR [Sedimentibacter sp.]|jgi:spoIIIJ-associated protein|nr:protein jag [Sedimentibacter sp.]NLA14528.1 protein jag [Tissierellia bacterium]HAS91758.1 protein jag [Clostridiales bacterium]HOA19109.1 RNA-binding cell elongation regulator Jag/EloR [Sedimentibacter sp.]HOG62229.1 RNA-binding cell elongation regulator Jag/EloR [Sedimentibacter sp.]